MSKFNEKKINRLKKVDWFFRSVYLFPKNKRKYSPVNKTEVKEILLIGIWLIGDTIMHLPVINIIKKNYPNARITIVCEKQSEIILRTQNLVDNFIIFKCPWVVPVNYSLKSLAAFFLSARTANRTRYDLAFEFRGDWRSILYMNFINAARKVSYNYSGGEYMLTDAIIPDESIENLTQESLYLLKQFGCSYQERDVFPRLILNSADKEYLVNFKTENGLWKKNIIGVHPGTTQIVKRWNEKNYSDLIVKLAEKYNDRVFLLFEGPNERTTVAAIEKELSAKGVEYRVVNRTLREYVLLISLCEIMICNDSGAAHIAGSYEIPVVVIFGSRGPGFVFPYGSKHQEMISHDLECKPCFNTYCKLGTILCLKGITVGEVFNKTCNILNLLNKRDLVK
jgi:lipopolysaccharide heptosyltransferase II